MLAAYTVFMELALTIIIKVPARRWLRIGLSSVLDGCRWINDFQTSARKLNNDGRSSVLCVIELHLKDTKQFS